MRLTVKLGGSLLESPAGAMAILREVVSAVSIGHQVILVHGGGKRLSRRLAQMGIESRFSGGLRITDEDTLAVAVMVLAGEVNKGLVRDLNTLGVRGVGLCGADGGSVRCRKLERSAVGESGDDLGYVGVPHEVDKALLIGLLQSGFVPVVASIGQGDDGHLYNVNADQMAAACAWGTVSDSLVYLTDVPGVRDETGSVIPRLSVGRTNDLKRRGVIAGGMLPKTASCLEALARGVRRVRIVEGSVPEALSRFVEGGLQEGTQFDADSD
jgi:acetylglutamate kinase